MKYKDIPAHEEAFCQTLKDSDGLEYEQEVVTSVSFPLMRLKPKGVTNYFYEEETKKTKIALHFTCGVLKGDLATLVEQDSHVSVSYVIARNGNVYELFDPKYWSYHLGRGTIGGNTEMSRSSIAIELSNMGPLRYYPGCPTVGYPPCYQDIYNTMYCTAAEGEAYQTLPAPYRMYSTFATFTDAQYSSLNALLTHLCTAFDIPKRFTNHELFDRISAETYEGICSHVNFRAYGKVDIGPAFQWAKITP